MSLSRREAFAATLSALAAGAARAAVIPRVYEVQGGQYPGPDGAQLFYRRMGTGPAVVLLHGFLSDGPRSWFGTGLAQTLVQSGFMVVAPDARAHGLSAAPPGPYLKDVLAMDVEALIHVLGLRSFRLFGYGMGSRTAIRLMARGSRPERCILGGTGIDAALDVERLAADYIESMRSGRDGRDPRLGVLIQAAIRLQKLNPEALAADLRSMVSTPAAELSGVGTPILVLDGARDDVEGSPDALAALFRDAAVLRTHGDHATALREPRYAAVAAAFLKSRVPPANFVPPIT
jgi:pimeloyl-ACP methyl ester carboxylesterase